MRGIIVGRESETIQIKMQRGFGEFTTHVANIILEKTPEVIKFLEENKVQLAVSGFIGGLGYGLYNYPGYTVCALAAWGTVSVGLMNLEKPTVGGVLENTTTKTQTQLEVPNSKDSIENVKSFIGKPEQLPPGEKRLVFTSTQTNTDEVDLSTAPFDFFVEFFRDSSVEDLFHYIRYKAFMSSTSDQKKEVIKALCLVSCRKYDTITPILTFVKSDDIAGLLEFAKTKVIPVESYIKSFEQYNVNVMILKDINEIIDIYFEEADPLFSLRVLKTLLFFEVIDDGTIYKNYISKLRSMDSDTKELFVSTNFSHSFII